MIQQPVLSAIKEKFYKAIDFNKIEFVGYAFQIAMNIKHGKKGL